MRKRTIKFCADKLLWLIVFLLPLLLCLTANIGGIDMTIDAVFNQYFNIGEDNIIFDAINQMFGADGYLPIYGTGSYLPYIITWFSCVIMIQLVYDFLMFVPKLAHKYMHTFTQDEE